MDATTDELIREFVAAGGRPQDWRPDWDESAWRPTYSIAPTTSAPIVSERLVEGTVQRGLELARWDWPKPANRPSGPPIINARIEKLDQGFWVGAFSNSRVAVPMRGYYEWTGERGDKQPHFIHGEGLLAAAGLAWTATVAGERRRVFVVVTREARDASGEVHDRMPAFLDDELLDRWLAPEPLTVPGDSDASRARRHEMLDLLDHSSTEIARTIRTYEVDRKVNSTRAVDPFDPSLIEPLPQ